MKNLLLLFIIFLSANVAYPQWIKQTVNTTASLRGLSVISEKVIWASGTDGTVIKTTDGGKNWSVTTIQGAEKLDFRDIEAFDKDTAYALSIGNGDNSRIYKTTDGGETWERQFVNRNEKAFFDAIACWDKKNCIAMSDPVDGKYLLISTSNGGKEWEYMTASKMPAAKDGEAAFAASGTCLIVNGKKDVYLVSGGNDARVFRSTDRGLNWTVAETPVTKETPGSGIFSIAFRNELQGVIVGGNYEKPTESVSNLAFSADAGKTWFAGQGLSGYRSAVVYTDEKTLIAVGTNGSDISTDLGVTWKKFGSEDLNAVAAKGMKAVWAVGPKGMVVTLK